MTKVILMKRDQHDEGVTETVHTSNTNIDSISDVRKSPIVTSQSFEKLSEEKPISRDPLSPVDIANDADEDQIVSEESIAPIESDDPSTAEDDGFLKTLIQLTQHVISASTDNIKKNRFISEKLVWLDNLALRLLTSKDVPNSDLLEILQLTDDIRDECLDTAITNEARISHLEQYIEEEDHRFEQPIFTKVEKKSLYPKENDTCSEVYTVERCNKSDIVKRKTKRHESDDEDEESCPFVESSTSTLKRNDTCKQRAMPSYSNKCKKSLVYITDDCDNDDKPYKPKGIATSHIQRVDKYARALKSRQAVARGT